MAEEKCFCHFGGYKVKDAEAREKIAAIAVESAEHPGCYYRTVDGEIEWLNPPIEVGVEYRTTERCWGKVVYVKLFDCGAATNGKYVVHGLSNYAVVKYDSGHRPFFFGAKVGTEGEFNSWVAVAGDQIRIYCGANAVGEQVYCRIYYIKD